MSETSPPLIRIASVCHQTGVKRAMIYKLLRQDQFPRPAKIGRASVWAQSEITDWIKDRLESPRHTGGAQ